MWSTFWAVLVNLAAVEALRVSDGPSGAEVAIGGGGGVGCLFGALYVPGAMRGDELVCAVPRSLVGAVRVCAVAEREGGCASPQEGFFVGEPPSDVLTEREEAEQGSWLLVGGRALDAANLTCVVAGVESRAVSMSSVRALCRIPSSCPPGRAVPVAVGVDLVRADPVTVTVTPRARSHSRLLALAPTTVLPGDNATLTAAVDAGEMHPLHVECAMGTRIAPPVAASWTREGRLAAVCAVPLDWQPGPNAATLRISGALLAPVVALRVADFPLRVLKWSKPAASIASSFAAQKISRIEGWAARIALVAVLARWIWALAGKFSKT
jgi:hypothetical protein